VRASYAWLVLVTLCFPACAQAETPESSPASITGTGCVEPGIETGCLVLHDLKTSKNFNLFFRAQPPSVDTAISFEGTESNNPNFCMQGQPIDVTKWTPIRLHCPASSAPMSSQLNLTGAHTYCADWAAWYNVQPGSPKTLHVAGMCTFPTSGYKAELTKRVPPGVNLKIYMVDLTITPPTGKVSQIVRHVPIHFSEQTDRQYDSVQIEPDHVNVRVRIVQ
jgi:hypothetical protein